MSNETLLQTFTRNIKYYTERELDRGFQVNAENHILYLRYRDAGFLEITNTKYYNNSVSIHVKLSEKGQAIRYMALL